MTRLRLPFSPVFSEYLPEDGTIGIPVELSVYNNRAAHPSPVTGAAPEDALREPNTCRQPKDAKPVVVYVRGTNTRRIGREADEKIISDLVSEGYIVVVLDYLGHEKACPPALDWSLQKLRCEIDREGKHLGSLMPLRGYNYVLPAGYRIARGIRFWNLVEHGAEGTEERIVEIWNRDLRTMRAKDTVVLARDGRRRKVSEICADSLSDCVKPDGSPIDTDLYLDIIYPALPERKVPVMFLASSSETRSGAWTMPLRPHLTGFLFRGYAGVIFDYAYVPVARNDHYGYYYDCSVPTQDYGVSFYTGIKASTAAVRCVRWLSDRYPRKYRFDRERFGGFGHSKSGYVYALGNRFPERLPEQFYYTGHRGEAPIGSVQPWLTYRDGSVIAGNLQAVYGSSGAAANYCYDEGSFAPTFTTAGEDDGSYIGFYTNLLRNGRQFDIPTVGFSMPGVGHTIVYGYHDGYGTDLYRAFFDFMDCHLSSGPLVCLYALPRSGSENVSPNSDFTLKFTASVDREELLSHVSLRASDGTAAVGVWSARYGRTEWRFAARDLIPGETYTLALSEGLRAENGKTLAAPFTSTVRVQAERSIPLSPMVSGFTVDGVAAAEDERVCLRFGVSGLAANRLRVSAGEYGTVSLPIAGAGTYECDVTEIVRAAGGSPITFTLRTEKPTGKRTLVDWHFDNLRSELYRSHLALARDSTAELSAEANATPGGKAALKLVKANAEGDLRLLYRGGVNRLTGLIKAGELTERDLGRLFHVRLRVMTPDGDTPRYFCCAVGYTTDMKSKYIDKNDRTWRMLHPTESGKWYEISFDYLIDDPDYVDPTIQKKDLLLSFDGGTVFIDDLCITEETTPVIVAPRGSETASAPALVIRKK